MGRTEGAIDEMRASLSSSWRRLVSGQGRLVSGTIARSRVTWRARRGSCSRGGGFLLIHASMSLTRSILSLRRQSRCRRVRLSKLEGAQEGVKVGVVLGGAGGPCVSRVTYQKTTKNRGCQYACHESWVETVLVGVGRVRELLFLYYSTAHHTLTPCLTAA